MEVLPEELYSQGLNGAWYLVQKLWGRGWQRMVT